MTVDEALAFVATHGIVLESTSGPVPSLVATILGEPVRGSWWGHPQSHEIFGITRAVRASPSVLVCRLVQGKVTLVHRRLWPAVVRVADRFPADRVAQIVEVHTPAGHHRVEETPFPDWVPALARTRRRCRKRRRSRHWDPGHKAVRPRSRIDSRHVARLEKETGITRPGSTVSSVPVS